MIVASGWKQPARYYTLYRCAFALRYVNFSLFMHPDIDNVCALRRAIFVQKGSALIFIFNFYGQNTVYSRTVETISWDPLRGGVKYTYTCHVIYVYIYIPQSNIRMMYSSVALGRLETIAL